MRVIKKRRRLEGKTDYRKRAKLLLSGKPRIVFRKTNRYIVGQYVKSEEAQDSVAVGLTSKELLDYGWPLTMAGSLKSIPASYLAGFLLGKKILDREEKAKSIFDIGLIRNVKKSRAYAFLKGIIDSGVEIKGKEELFPDEKKLKGINLKNRADFDKIKENINKKFA